MSKIAKLSVNEIMIWVILSALPALGFLGYWQGWGFVLNLGLAVIAGLGIEWICARKRGEWFPAIVTAILLSAGIPAFASWWVILVGIFFALVVGKHLFGGLGQNIFNPAMVGYAVILVAFPTEMVVWPAWSTDAISAATPLDHAHSTLLDHPYQPWVILNLLWAVGGLVLLLKKIIPWALPGGFLLGFLITALFFPQPLLQLGLGATMIGAFFIVTDPVTAPATPKARFFYAFLIGVWVILMRHYSHYPDGLAFAILLGNACAPLLDLLSQRKRA